MTIKATIFLLLIPWLAGAEPACESIVDPLVGAVTAVIREGLTREDFPLSTLTSLLRSRPIEPNPYLEARETPATLQRKKGLASALKRLSPQQRELLYSQIEALVDERKSNEHVIKEARHETHRIFAPRIIGTFGLAAFESADLFFHRNSNGQLRLVMYQANDRYLLLVDPSQPQLAIHRHLPRPPNRGSFDNTPVVSHLSTQDGRLFVAQGLSHEQIYVGDESRQKDHWKTLSPVNGFSSLNRIRAIQLIEGPQGKIYVAALTKNNLHVFAVGDELIEIASHAFRGLLDNLTILQSPNRETFKISFVEDGYKVHIYDVLGKEKPRKQKYKSKIGRIRGAMNNAGEYVLAVTVDGARDEADRITFLTSATPLPVQTERHTGAAVPGAPLVTPEDKIIVPLAFTKTISFYEPLKIRESWIKKFIPLKSPRLMANQTIQSSNATVDLLLDWYQAPDGRQLLRSIESDADGFQSLNVYDVEKAEPFLSKITIHSSSSLPKDLKVSFSSLPNGDLIALIFISYRGIGAPRAEYQVVNLSDPTMNISRGHAEHVGPLTQDKDGHLYFPVQNNRNEMLELHRLTE